MNLIDERSAVANLLRRLEVEGDMAGWDSHLAVPHIFFVFKDRETGKLRTRTAEILMDGLRRIVGDAEVPMGIALRHLADHAKYVEGVFRVEFGVDGDLVREEGADLVAMAFRSEGWALEATSAEHHEAAQVPYSISKHPDRIEYRFVLAVERDGLMWMVERKRRADNAQEIHTAWAEGDSTDAHFGNIHRGLVALFNAVSGEAIKLTERAGLPE